PTRHPERRTSTANPATCLLLFVVFPALVSFQRPICRNADQAGGPPESLVIFSEPSMSTTNASMVLASRRQAAIEDSGSSTTIGAPPPFPTLASDAQLGSVQTKS